MFDSLKMSLSDTLLLTQTYSDPAAVFGAHTLPVYSAVDYSAAEPLLRSNLLGISFGTGISLFLLIAMVLFFCFSQRKKITAIAFYIFNFKKFLKIQPVQQWLNFFIFAGFSLLTLALLAANLWHVQFATPNIGIPFVIALGGLMFYFLSKYFICFVIQVIAQQRMFLFNIFSANVYVFFAMSLLVVPLFFVQMLVIPIYFESLLTIQMWIAGIFLLYYFVKTLTIFIADRIPIFFWMLYICTFEILPIMILYKMLLTN
jgi:hypothetical protein